VRGAHRTRAKPAQKSKIDIEQYGAKRRFCEQNGAIVPRSKIYRESVLTLAAQCVINVKLCKSNFGLTA
jgi:hypothetical protein